MIFMNKNPQNPANQQIHNNCTNYYRSVKTGPITAKNHIQLAKKERETISQPKAKTAYACLLPVFLFFCDNIVA